ncbi:glycosyltransferase [Hoeflea sp. WL0058]|uniref:Glycosyltransferase n=1 Tax=Flavimaribacter sediminis TaxID=2865987 RepID=A0AAE2ZM91_9HYPH|nr:glycosyltransferase [Flavimaribacter sediminis]MBW8639198.1 glycosyltransferase [Flavimaribacter sediminis]
MHDTDSGINGEATTCASLEKAFGRAGEEFLAGNHAAARNAMEGFQEKLIPHCKIIGEPGPENPRFSIVVLNYKQSLDFAALVFSLSGVSRTQECEVVFVNNGNPSLEKTVFDRLDCYVRIDAPFNVGCSEGRNIGARLARGEYVIFLDDDGAITEDTIGALVSVIARHGAVAVRGRIVPKSPGGSSAENYDLGDRIRPAIPSAEGISIWRRDLFLEFGGFDPLLVGHEGLLLCARMLPFFGPERFLYTPEALLIHDFADAPEQAAEKSALYDRNDAYIGFCGYDKSAVQRIFSVYRRPTRQSKAFEFRKSLCLPPPNDDAPELTVLTVARNVRDRLDDYRRMLGLQTWRNFKVVFVDDGSDDDTADRLLDLWSGEYDRLALVRTDGVGRGAAFDHAIARAESDVCVIAEIGDISVADRFAQTASYFAQHPYSGCVCFDIFSDRPMKIRPDGPQVVAPSTMQARALFGAPGPFSCFAFRKSAFLQSFDASLDTGAELEWVHRNLENGASGHFLPTPEAYHPLPVDSDQRTPALALERVIATHARYLAHMDDGDKRCAGQLAGLVPLQSEDDVTQLRTYECRFLEALGDFERELAVEIAMLMDLRIRDLEHIQTKRAIARQQERSARKSFKKDSVMMSGARIGNELRRWTRKMR